MVLHVVAGVVYNAKNEILIARRLDHSDQGGLWEFPGGKVKKGESAEHALVREFKEEIGIDIQKARPLIRITHEYTHKKILLDVWQVEKWQGQAQGLEGQVIEWCVVDKLLNKKFPTANYPIIKAIRLPERYLITAEPEKWHDKKFFYHLAACLDTGISLIQLRAKQLSQRDYCYCAEKILKLCQSYHADLLVNSTPEIALSVGAQGVHLNSQRLTACALRPLPNHLIVSASCHFIEEIQQANAIQTDFIVLSPIKATRSHPRAKPLGWLKFFELSTLARCPVFALGGMKVNDLEMAWAHGGQGIAGIRRICEV